MKKKEGRNYAMEEHTDWLSLISGQLYIIQKILTQRSTVDINMISKENLDCEKKEHIEPNC